MKGILLLVCTVHIEKLRYYQSASHGNRETESIGFDALRRRSCRTGRNHALRTVSQVSRKGGVINVVG